jgi:hypothetical protein
MIEQRRNLPARIDLSDPRRPMTLGDWLARYPHIPMRTVSLCLWEAGNLAAHSSQSDEDQNALVAWLMSERLDELRRYAGDPVTQDTITLPELAAMLSPRDA